MYLMHKIVILLIKQIDMLEIVFYFAFLFLKITFLSTVELLYHLQMALSSSNFLLRFFIDQLRNWWFANVLREGVSAAVVM